MSVLSALSADCLVKRYMDVHKDTLLFLLSNNTTFVVGLDRLCPVSLSFSAAYQPLRFIGENISGAI